MFGRSREIAAGLDAAGYVAGPGIVRAIRMADLVGAPLLVEGPTGVGKSALGQALSQAADARLIRLQCYDGIGEAQALYEWNFAKQILCLHAGADRDVFGDEFLHERPLLAAVRSSVPTVLLVDEIDRATLEFDAMLLEFLSEYALTIGERGTVAAMRRPFVLLTSVGTRELSDALRRRCHYLHVPQQSPVLERRILDRAVPDTPGLDTDRIVGFVDALRENGVSCGASGLVDAVRALLLVDRDDRDQLREALCCTLVGREIELPTFRALFELWFPAGDVTPVADDPIDALADEDADLRGLAAGLVGQFGGYRSRDGESFSALQVERALDPDATIADLAVRLGGGGSSFDSAVAQETARARVAALRAAITADVNRRVAERRSVESVARYAVPRTTAATRRAATENAELAAVRRAVGELGRILATREASSRRRARAGEIDLRRTMRRSMSTGGVPITLVRRKPRIAKPELVVLCDMSSSVAEFTYFTVILVDALRKAFSRVRIFAFVDRCVEVTRLFPPGGDLEAAMGKIGSTPIGLGRRTDYGGSFAAFLADYPDAVNARTSVLVVGDARGNFLDPRADLVADLARTVKDVHWLNPEPRNRWGTGDSAASVYGELVTMHECRNAAQLSRVVTQLVR